MSRAILGAITVGTSEPDSTIREIRNHLPESVEIAIYGILDGFTDDQVADLAPEPGQVGIVSVSPGGNEVLLSHEKIIPLVSEQVTRAEADGVAATVVLCGAGWQAVPRTKPLIDPGSVFPSVVTALAGPQRLGIVKPSAGQIAKEKSRYEAWGVNVAVTSANPYAENLEQVRQAGRFLLAAGTELVWMTCVDFTEAHREAMAEETGVPVILARTLISRILAEVMASATVPSFA